MTLLNPLIHRRFIMLIDIIKANTKIFRTLLISELILHKILKRIQNDNLEIRYGKHMLQEI